MIENGLQTSYILRKRADIRRVESYRPILKGNLAFAMRKDDNAARAKPDRSLAKLQANGVVTEITKTWGVNPR